jgi:protein-arginine deiminase
MIEYFSDFGGKLTVVFFVAAIGCSGNSTDDTRGTDPNFGIDVYTDTNRDGSTDQFDIPNHTDWSWEGDGAFLLPNVDDDNSDNAIDAANDDVDGTEDALDLARIVVELSAYRLANADNFTVSITEGTEYVHLFQTDGSNWYATDGMLETAASFELGIEATQFASSHWDGFVKLKVEFAEAGKIIATREVKMRVAPWIMLPNSARTEMMYMANPVSVLLDDLNALMPEVGLPEVHVYQSDQTDRWTQDTMEVGYTQLPGNAPMHVVMKAQRGEGLDPMARTLLAPDFGFISIAEPRPDLSEEDHWMDWMGNLEVTHPVPGFPLGRIYYGSSEKTTFHPAILAFIEAQEVQAPFTIDTSWLVIQHVDEVLNFVPGTDGSAKMIVSSPRAASQVLGTTSYDSYNQDIQALIDDTIEVAKTELDIDDDDIVELPVYYSALAWGSGAGANWSSPVNSPYVNGSIIIGNTETEESVKADIEGRLSAVGVDVAWVHDADYHQFGGNVHCGTNTAKTPVCENFTACLPGY